VNDLFCRQDKLKRLNTPVGFNATDYDEYGYLYAKHKMIELTWIYPIAIVPYVGQKEDKKGYMPATKAVEMET